MELSLSMAIGAARRAAAALSRLIPQFNGTDNYATLDTPAVLESGDLFEFEFFNLASPANLYFCDGDSTGVNRGYVWATSGAIAWNTAVFSGGTLDGVAMTSGVTALPTDGVAHVVAMTVSATCVIQALNTRYTFDVFGAQHLTYYKTTISSVESETKLIRRNPLYDLPEGEVEGSEETTNGTFTGSADGWVLGGTSVYNNNAVDVNVPAVTTALSQDLAAPTAGDVFLLEIVISGYVDGTLRAISYGSGSSNSVSGNGTHEVLITNITTTAATLNLINGWVPFEGTVESVSVKLLPNPTIYTNMDDVDWHSYLYSDDLSRWDYQGSGIAGSQLMEFTGTATTPLSSSITVTGSTWEMNWEGLWVEHYSSGVGAYTYLAAPDGVPMRLDVHDPASVTELHFSNFQMTGELPSFELMPLLVDFRALNNQLTGDIPSLTANISLQVFWVHGSNHISGWTPSTLAPTLYTLALSENDLTVTAVDQVLSDLADSVALHTRTGSLSLHAGTNAAPTDGASNADVVYLQGQGWTVNHN